MKLNRYRRDHLSESALRADSAFSSEGSINDHLSESQINDHLSEDQINDHLIGDLGWPAAAHLAGCKLCESRVAVAVAPIEAFKAVTVAWSERRSATLPLHQSIASSARFHPRVAWSAMLAVALAVGVAIPLAHQQRQESTQAHADSQAAAPMSNARNAGSGDQIVRDNQMLRAIDRELDASVESQEALGLQPLGTATARKASPPPSVQD